MFALIPVKSFAKAKQRLSSVLDETARSHLAEAMLRDVLAALRNQSAISAAAVCTADPAVISVADEFGLEVLADTEQGGLNASVAAATESLAERGVSEVMVIHGDLPLLTSEELGTFIAAHRAIGRRAVTVTPDRRHDGSNLLAWDPSLQFTPAYGPASFQRHLQQATRLGLMPVVCELPGAGFDVDETADYVSLIEQLRQLPPATRRMLEAFTQRIGSESRP